VSRDSITSHQKFRKKLNLPFPLLSDPGGAVCEKYGVIKEKKMFGKSVKGIVRSTFVIDGKGAIAAVWHGVKVKGHVEDVLKSLAKK
jgi:peroxiredoxin Q/BCP